MTNKLSSQNSLYGTNVLDGFLQDSVGRAVLWFFFECCCWTPCNDHRILLKTEKQQKGSLKTGLTLCTEESRQMCFGFGSEQYLSTYPEQEYVTEWKTLKP